VQCILYSSLVPSSMLCGAVTAAETASSRKDAADLEQESLFVQKRTSIQGNYVFPSIKNKC
jgi:hypothetical protein